LRRAPFPGRGLVPVRVGASGERPEDEVRENRKIRRARPRQARHDRAQRNSFHRSHTGILGVNTVRRYPITVALILLVLLSAINPLPSLVDAATGAPVADADLVRPLEYVIAAPLSDVLDALTFLSLQRACALLAVWAAALA